MGTVSDPGLHGQRADDRRAIGELLVQQTILRHRLVQGADQRFDVVLQLGDLFGVGGPQFLQLSDLPAQPFLAVRHLAAGADLVVEGVLE
ncbi:hypothetical protein [Streptomyces sp. AC558_RSS880]|uniref:hypothetical protein n=1 Tax=Streptomyces sp. AC558_RSS880 TaxID=2823687 RepID=UPI001C217EAF|nr:hypothetical protein [Streptomyces sp. AC558_RSS880]